MPSRKPYVRIGCHHCFRGKIIRHIRHPYQGADGKRYGPDVTFDTCKSCNGVGTVMVKRD